MSLIFLGPGTFWHSKARCKLRGSRTHTVGVNPANIVYVFVVKCCGKAIEIRSTSYKILEITWMNKYWIQISQPLPFILVTRLHHISIYHIDIMYIYTVYIYICTYTYIIYYRSVQICHRNCLGSCKILAPEWLKLWSSQRQSCFWSFCAIDTRSLAFGSRKLSGDLPNLKQMWYLFLFVPLKANSQQLFCGLRWCNFDVPKGSHDFHAPSTFHVFTAQVFQSFKYADTEGAALCPATIRYNKRCDRCKRPR